MLRRDTLRTAIVALGLAALGAVPLSAQPLRATGPSLTATAPSTLALQRAPSFVRGGLETLFDQSDDFTGGIVSQFNIDTPAFDVVNADDFTVPEGVTWTVQRVVADGFYSANSSGTPQCTSADIGFWSNGAEEPDTPVFLYEDTPVASDDAGLLAFDVPATVLETGTYWLSIQCIGSLNFDTTADDGDPVDIRRWNWFRNNDNDGTGGDGASGVIRNDGGAFGLPAGWNAYSAGVLPDGFDLNFMLMGSAEGEALVPELVYAPDRLVGSTAPDDSTVVPLTLANEGLADLTYSFPAFEAQERLRDLAQQGVDLSARALQRTRGAIPEGTKGQDSPKEPSGPMSEYRVVGPDGYGYVAIDSEEDGGPAYDFVDISATGTPLNITDDGEVNVVLPFDFEWYGTSTRNVRVGSNGAVLVDTTAGNINAGNGTLPSADTNNGIIAPLWDDFNSSSGTNGNVYAQDMGDGRYIVQWHNIPRFGGSEIEFRHTFQMVMYDNGDVLFQYAQLQSPNLSGTIGFENLDGTDGLTVSQNEAGYPTAGLAILVTRPPAFISSVSPSSGVIAPGMSEVVEVTFDATGFDPGTYSDQLMLVTNDEDEMEVTIPARMVVGEGLMPAVSVDPESIAESINAGEITETTVTFTNTGDGPLQVTLPQFIGGDRQWAPAHEGVRRTTADAAKGTHEPKGSAQRLDGGGPDAFGYSWMDSNEPGGPSYDWVDISATGTAIAGADDAVTLADIGFAFDFYGTEFSEVNISTNGFLTFTGSSSDFSNNPIPDPAEPNAIVAPFWDDQDTGDGVGEILYETRGDTFIVQYDGVPHYPGPGNPGELYTYQVMLFADGTIKFQYQSMNGILTSATVGIENLDGSDGLQIVNNAEYITDGLAIEITRTPEWLADASPASFTLLPGETQDVTVTLDGTDLVGGVYEAGLRVATNVEGQETFEIPVTLTVIGVIGPITFDPGSVDFGDVIVGNSNLVTVTVTNTGSETATISGITSSDAQVTVVGGPTALAPGESGELTLEFTPTASGAVTGTVEVASDKANSPSVLEFSAMAFAAPVGAVDPASITIEAVVGSSGSREFTISNTAGVDAADLEYAIQVTSTFTRPVIEYPEANAANPASTDGPRHGAQDALAEPGEAFDVAGGDELVQDGGFEAGSPNPSWSEGSTNFGSPLCTAAGCGVGGGTGPHSGSWWVWFGGTTSAEDGFVEQEVTIPSGSAELSFWLEIPTANIPGSMSVLMDGEELISFNETDQAVFDTYQLVVLDVSAYGDGGTHTLRFEASNAAGADVINFFVDDVSLISTGPAIITVAPMEGSVAPGDEETITVSYDLTDVPAGQYNFELVIQTNEPDGEPLTVDVLVDAVVSGEAGAALPTEFALRQSFPNPAAGVTTVKYDLPRDTDVSIRVYDALGRQVATLVEGVQTAGYKEVKWDTRSLASGVYLYRIEAGSYAETAKMVVVR